ncbi:unnamed protein product [marine sediment metagenome]|uniref:Uncharacterized protein n=1 Tax=marine sediment metagenome TaxID=412755 RepID=X1MNJ4_9ZZZZ
MLTPDGVPPIQLPLRVTFSVLPASSVTVTVVVLSEPGCTERMSGDALTEKSNAGSFIVRVMLVEWVWPPPVPFT